MTTYTNYKLVRDSVYAIGDAIKPLLEDGWQPLGGPLAVPTPYKDLVVQTLVKAEGGGAGSGVGVAIKGVVPTAADLPPTGADGDVYIAADTGDGFVWVDSTASWENVGQLRGPAGLDSAVVERLAGTAPLSALRAVWEDSAGLVHPASRTAQAQVLALVGITTTGVSAVGESVLVQRTGHIDDTAWAWLPQQKVWLGVGGALTQTPPKEGDGYDVVVGVALSPTRLLIQMGEPIALLD